MCFKWEGAIPNLSGRPLRLIDKFTYIISSVSSTESDVDISSKCVDFYWLVIDHMEVWFIQWNKMGFLPGCGYVSTTVWMHHMDTNKAHGEKARWELHKNAISYFEQILETIPHETTAVWPLTSHLKNHPRKTNKTCGTLMEKQGQTHKWHSSMNPYLWMCQCWPTNKNLFTSALCGYRMEFRGPARNNLMIGTDGWVRKIHAVSTIWSYFKFLCTDIFQFGQIKT